MAYGINMTEFLNIQHDVAVALSSSTNLYDNLNMLLDHMLQLNSIDSGAIHFINEKTAELEFIVCKGFSQKFEQYLRDIKKPTHVMTSVMSGVPSVIKSKDIITSCSGNICTSEKLGTILFYPIKHNGKVIAVMSVSSHSQEEISKKVVLVTETIIAHVQSVIVCNKVECELNELLKLGKLLSETSTHFIGLEPEKIDESINNTLRKIGEVTEVEKIGVFIFSEDGKYVTGTHEWCAQGVESDLQYFINLPVDAHIWWKTQLCKREPFYIHHLNDLPPEATLEKKVLQEMKTKSLLVIPMEYRGHILGNMCLAYSSKYEWPEKYLKILKLMGEVFANALEHKRKEFTIKKNESKYRRIFEEIHDIYFETDLSGVILTLSPSVKTHLGYEPDELIGLFPNILYNTSSERQKAIAAIQDVGHLDNQIIRIQDKYGNIIHFSVNDYLVYDSYGKPEKIAGIARDVTEIKKIEKLLVEAKLLLENASNTKRDFLSIFNHELRTPLTHVIGYAEVLKDEHYGPLNDRQLKCVNTILTSGNALLELITSLNYVAELEEGKMELEISDFSISSLIAEIQKITNSMALKKKIELKFNVDPNIQKVIADKSKVKIILLNLINNAIKFTPEKGVVIIDVKLDTNGSLYISVKDTGIGISKEDQVILFKPFTQLEPVLNRRNGGAGLGLALVKEFVEIQGGTISLISEVNKGTIFEITIPMLSLD